MYEKLDSCPICSSSEYNNVLICKDHLVSYESFVIVECQQCGFYFTNPRPAIGSIARYYESEQYASHSKKSSSPFQLIYNFVRYYTLRSKRKIINQFATRGPLLDIGCGTGNFLKVCKKNGWTISGIEPNTEARLLAEKKTGATIYNNIQNIPSDKLFSAITLWHVLEHIHDLDLSIKKIINLLDENGTLFVAVPNHEAFDAHYYNQHWAGWDVPRHLYHFKRADVKKLFKKYNLGIIQTLPMKFDSYYVSLLSEKYKYGKQRPLKALKVGRKSNLQAKYYTNYSSLIYIIKK